MFSEICFDHCRRGLIVGPYEKEVVGTTIKDIHYIYGGDGLAAISSLPTQWGLEIRFNT